MDGTSLHQWIEQKWDLEVIPTISTFIEIPNQSPHFDSEWKSNGLLEKAANICIDWVKKQNISGLNIELIKSEDRTPLIFIEIDGSSNKSDTILMYGHFDKQPPLTDAWAEGLHPYTPVIKDGKLYGRGAHDDGYAIFAAVSSIGALQAQGIPHSRIVIIIEGGEESGSPDLPFYMDHLASRISGPKGIDPSLVICLDSGCGNYEQFWLTTSLRGLVDGELTVRILTEGVHSGSASGIVPSSFRIARQLISRIEDENSGKIKPDFLHCTIPPARIEQTKASAEVLGKSFLEEIPLVEGARTVTNDLVEILLNKAWYPTLSVIGAEGLPSLKTAGNVLRTHTSFKLSVRVPPSVNAELAAKQLKELVESNPPYNADVKFDVVGASGWDAPALQPWLEKALENASQSFFTKPCGYIGVGGSIPFMAMLGHKYPSTQFVVTGVGGPGSNAHGPNEYLHIDFTKKVTCCVASIIASHYQH